MIRRAALTDVEAIVAVFERSFATLDFLPRLHTHEQHLGFFDRCVADCETWVADDGEVLGFVVLREAELTQLYVDPSAFRRGIGAALLDTAKAERPDGFTLWVFQENAGARRFYEAHGLQCVRLTDGSFNEERTPDALYAWDPPADRGSSAR
ncbi:MAG TPA: GNAT family N-acetyltransferase [Gaiellaceae bacterium]|nr:GNAT family N-acetyltransferase [Gaiellaceae bacterium]